MVFINTIDTFRFGDFAQNFYAASSLVIINSFEGFEIKGQTKAAAAFKGVWPLFDL